jgi:hypothetical protein
MTARKSSGKSNRTRRPPTGPAADAEAADYAESLRQHGQLHEGPGPLAPGATHVASKSGGKPTLKRKRFSAL